MSREEALNKTIGILTYHQVNFCKSKEAVANMNEIIDALENIDQECVADKDINVLTTDCIRRSDVENAIKHAEVNFTVNSDIDFTKHKREVQEIVNGIIDAQIKALRELLPVTPMPQELCEDCIRRSDIGLTDFEIVMCDGDYKEGLKMLLEKIEKAPSVSPQPKMGRWNFTKHYGRDYYVCSVCGMERMDDHSSGWNYCPNCGAKMQEVNNE